MRTYVYLRYTEPGDSTPPREWSPRTHYSEHPDQVVKRMAPIIAEEYQGKDDAEPVPVGMLLVYFPGGSEPGGEKPRDMPSIYEYSIRRHLPEITRRLG